MASLRTVLLECKVWKCDSLTGQTKQRREIPQKTNGIIISSTFSILPMPWAVCTLLNVQISIKYAKNPLPTPKCREYVEISSKAHKLPVEVVSVFNCADLCCSGSHWLSTWSLGSLSIVMVELLLTGMLTLILKNVSSTLSKTGVME